MELIKKNIHMERMKCKANTQITVEEDLNIWDNKPDVLRLIMDQGKLEFDEIRAMQDCAVVRGKVVCHMMYLSDESEKKLCQIETNIPFEEKINLDGLLATDTIHGKGEIEDLSVELINSRKLSIHGLLNLIFTVEELYTREVAVEVANQDEVQIQKNKLEISCIEVQKKDIFRVKEEIELPGGYPNIFQLIWKNCKVTSLEWKLLDEKISIQGECTVFFLYEGEGENNPTRWYETTITFSGLIECQGCKESMVGDISIKMEHQEMEIKADFDGEERIVGLDLSFDLDIKIYDTKDIEVITDLYGIKNEVKPVIEEEIYKNLLMKNNGKTKVVQNLKIHSGEERILQICHVEGDVLLEKSEVTENKITVYGMLFIQLLYVTGRDELPYSSMKRSIPFIYSLDVPNMTTSYSHQIETVLEQLTVTMLDGEEVEVRSVVSCKAIVFQNKTANIVNGMEIVSLNLEKMNTLPSIVAYIAKEGDTIWEVGKKYYVPISSIHEINHLQSEQLKKGDRILVVKEMR